MKTPAAYLLAAVFVLSPFTIECQQRKHGSVTSDIVVQSAPATLVGDPQSVAGISKSVEGINDKITSRALTIKDLTDAVAPANLQDSSGQTVPFPCPATAHDKHDKRRISRPDILILHISEWRTAGNTTIAGGRSDWYVLRRKPHDGRKAACTLANVPSSASSEDSPLLYGVRGAILIAFDKFQPGVPGSMLYKFSVTPQKRANIQNLGALFAAVTGAVTGGAPAAGPPQVEWFITVARLSGYKHLPFDFNISSVFTPLAQTGGGPNPAQANGIAPAAIISMPSATAGQVYNQQLVFTGGVGIKHFSSLASGGNAPPPGLNISPDGWLAGTPSFPTGGPVGFAVQIVDSETPTKPFTQMYQITVNAQGAIGGAPPANSAGTGSPSGTDTNQNSANTSNQSKQSGAVDCTTISDKTPCTVTHTFSSLDKEFWDVSLGITVPGVNETVFATPTGSPTVTRHTDLYGLFDIFPFAKWRPKDSAAPHINVGIPAAGKPFYRPYFGIAESVTSWTHLEKAGFPLPVSIYFGFVDLKIKLPAGTGASTVLKPTRVWKPLFGLEFPVSALVSKIKGSTVSSSSKSSSSVSGKGNQ